MAALNYSQAGVNREAADQLVEKIGLMARGTLNRRVKASVGGYASQKSSGHSENPIQ